MCREKSDKIQFKIHFTNKLDLELLQSIPIYVQFIPTLFSGRKNLQQPIAMHNLAGLYRTGSTLSIFFNLHTTPQTKCYRLTESLVNSNYVNIGSKPSDEAKFHYR